MKKGTVFMKLTSVLAVLLFFGGTIVSCGGGGDDAPPLTQIKSITDAENASSEANQAASLAAGVGETFSNLGIIAEGVVPAPRFKAPAGMSLTGGTAITSKLSDKFAKSPAVAAAAAAVKKAAGMKTSVAISGNGSCDSGSYSFAGSYDDVDLTFSIDFTFTTCRNDDTEIDGTYTLTGAATPTSFTMTMTLSNFSVIEYAPGTTTPVATMVADITFSGNFDGATYTMTGNGAMVGTEGGINYTLTFTNFRFTASETTEAEFKTGTITVNGGVSEGWTTTEGTFSASISYENFVVSVKEHLMNGDEEITINGVFTIDFTPDQCFEGRYSIQTTTPIYWDNLNDQTNAGRLVINGNTAIVFNANGTITVEYEGTPIPGLENVNELTLNGKCLIASL